MKKKKFIKFFFDKLLHTKTKNKSLKKINHHTSFQITILVV